MDEFIVGLDSYWYIRRVRRNPVSDKQIIVMGKPLEWKVIAIGRVYKMDQQTAKLGLKTWDQCNWEEKIERLRLNLLDLTKDKPLLRKQEYDPMMEAAQVNTTSGVDNRKLGPLQHLNSTPLHLLF